VLPGVLLLLGYPIGQHSHVVALLACAPQDGSISSEVLSKLGLLMELL
jgi:hypothetical protein